MKIELKNIKAGDFVYCTGDSGFCDPSDEVVKKVTTQYDENSGKPYNIIHLSGGRKFDSRSGNAINPPLSYYLTPTNQKTAKSEHDKVAEEEAKRKIEFSVREKEKKAILAKLTKEERQILGYN